MKKQMQKGFTLIELMIVIAIIGILAAFAIPTYQDYTARTQMGEAFLMASAQKIAVVESWSSSGSIPTNNKEAGLDAPLNYQGEYVQAVGVGAGGSISAIMKTATDFNGSKVSSRIRGAQLTLMPRFPTNGAFGAFGQATRNENNRGAVQWLCFATAADNAKEIVEGDADTSGSITPLDSTEPRLDSSLLPASCRSAQF